jgi:hypothetical protein
MSSYFEQRMKEVRPRHNVKWARRLGITVFENVAPA